MYVVLVERLMVSWILMWWPRLMQFSASVDVWFLQMGVVLVFLDPGLAGMAGLPNVDLTAFTGHAAHTRSLDFQVIFHRLKEAGDLLWG
jgi:hypothetical protein